MHGLSACAQPSLSLLFTWIRATSSPQECTGKAGGHNIQKFYFSIATNCHPLKCVVCSRLFELLLVREGKHNWKIILCQQVGLLNSILSIIAVSEELLCQKILHGRDKLFTLTLCKCFPMISAKLWDVSACITSAYVTLTSKSSVCLPNSTPRHSAGSQLSSKNFSNKKCAHNQPPHWSHVNYHADHTARVKMKTLVAPCGCLKILKEKKIKKWKRKTTSFKLIL